MSSLSDIKRRLTSVKQTRQITGAMETVSIAKMRIATERLQSSLAYNGMICDIMRSLYDSVNGQETVTPPVSGKNLVIVLSSDRGLCGGFDHEIFKCADSVIDDNSVVVPIGNAAYEKYGSRAQAANDFCASYIPNYSVAEKIGKYVLSQYGCGVKSVTVVYGSPTARSDSSVVARKILPLDFSDGARGEKVQVYEGSERDVFDALLPLYVSDEIYCALLNNVAAEHCARRAAMSAATTSADELISALSVEYNRARQSAVTEQIVEIIGSTSALEKNGSLQ